MSILSQLLQYKIVAIVRGAQPQDVPFIADALYNGGVRAVEITLNSDRAFEVIKNISRSMKDKMLVGAGTVLDAASAAEAIDAGAQFIIAPSLDVETIKLTKERNRISIPGAFTATEIVAAYKWGADLIKVFPASDPKYIKDLKGPLNHIPMMPTGGVNLDNINDFQKAGAVAFGIGSALVDTQQAATPDYLARLTENAARFINAVNQS